MNKEKDELAKIQGNVNPVITLRVSLMRQLLKNETLENKDFVDLSANDKIEITNQLKEIIKNNPDIYGSVSEIAEDLGNVEKTEKLTLTDKAKIFGSEVKEQASIKGKNIFIAAAVVGIVASVITILRSSADIAKVVKK